MRKNLSLTFDKEAKVRMQDLLDQGLQASLCLARRLPHRCSAGHTSHVGKKITAPWFTDPTTTRWPSELLSSLTENVQHMKDSNGSSGVLKFIPTVGPR